MPRTGLQGSEGDPTPWDGRPAEAESPLLSQGSSSFFSPPPPSLPEPPLGLGPASPRASERARRPAVQGPSGDGHLGPQWTAGGWDRRKGGGGKAGCRGGGGRGWAPLARRQARGRPWAGHGGRGGGGPRGGRQARGCGHGAQPPAHADRRGRRRCCSRHPSAGGGVAEQAAPQSPPAPPRPAACGPGGAEGIGPRPTGPRWGPPGPGRHVGTGDQVAWGARVCYI